MPAACDTLYHLSLRQWQPLLYWMDVSGLALYFHNRMTQSRQDAHLPAEVWERLTRNLEQSRRRTAVMGAEAAAIQSDLQQSGIPFAVLKGFSLWPVSVPKMELRSQLDLDYLISATEAHRARTLLEARGYSLRAISGNTWEFKSKEPGLPSLTTLYQAPVQRSVELHLEQAAALEESLLSRIEVRTLNSMAVPVLGQTDLFLGQGLHLYKHIASEFSRAAHLLEFYRHILVRFHDDTFWQELRTLAEQTPGAAASLGLVIHLITHLMGEFAPYPLTSWTVSQLPAAARLWVQLYSRRSVLSCPPGNKLYLLLQEAMQSTGVPAQRTIPHRLLPYRLPPRIFDAPPAESITSYFERQRRELVFRCSRLHFHLTQGIVLLWEYTRWRQRIRAEVQHCTPAPAWIGVK